jgi:ankyrin repeat protein
VTDADPVYDETPLAAAISAGMIETVKALLKLGADVNKACANGSAIHVAVETGNLAVVEVLLDSGADPNHRGKYGVTPLMIASGMGGGIFGSTELVDLLLQRGADFHAKDDAGGTALDMSAHAVAMLETSLAQSDHAAAETDSFRQMLDRVLKVREFLQAYEKAHAKPETL